MVASLLAIVIILTTFIPVYAVGQPTKYSSDSNSGQRDVVCTTLAGTGAANYYTGSYSYANLTAQTSSQLFTSLRKLMTDTHDYIASYANCRDYAVKTDCENNDGRIVMIYTSYSGTKGEYASGQGWNREHVWPQSLGGGNTSGGGADLHHIRPSEAKTNSTRGNLKYGYVTGGSSATGNLSGDLGGYRSGAYYEPLDNVKGDVARIILYVYVRWGSAWGADSVTEVFQSVDVLLEWCALDPVDTWEMGRNEVVEKIQGNRNVFIDYPELAWLIFGKSVPTNMVTPSGHASSGHTGNGGNSGTDNPGTDNPGTDNPGTDNPGTDTPGTGDPTPDAPCTHSSTEIRNYTPTTCQQDGYTGDTYCKSCNTLISKGSSIPSGGQHSFGDWQQSDDGTYHSECTVCGLRVDMNIDNILATIESEAEKILFLLALGSSDLSILDSLAQ